MAVLTTKWSFERSLFTILIVFQTALEAQYVPLTTSTVQGSSIITNFYDPFGTPSSGPGLNQSLSDARFSAPLGQSWSVADNSTNFNPYGVSPAYPLNSAFIPSTAPFPTVPAGTPFPAVTPFSGATPVPSMYPTQAPYPPQISTTVPTVQTLYSTPAATPAYTGVPVSPHSLPLVPPTSLGLFPQGVPAEPTYFYPGLVRRSRTGWIGSDYLFNLYPNIGVVVEIVTPAGHVSPIDTNIIKGRIEGIFSAAGIRTTAESVNGGAPLPFFHLLVFVTVVENRYYVFNMAGRFFEEVKLPRLNFPLPGTWQAITWEKQELVTTSAAHHHYQMEKTAEAIAQLFVERLVYYRHLQFEQEELLRVQCEPPSGLLTKPSAPMPRPEPICPSRR